MEILSLAGLRTAINEIESDPSDEDASLTEKLAALRPSAIHWANHSRQTQFLRRLAALVAATGDTGTAIALLQNAREITPGDTQIAMLLSDAFASENNPEAALEALSPALADPVPNMRCVRKATKLREQIERARKLAEPHHAYERVVAASPHNEARSKLRELLAANGRLELLSLAGLRTVINEIEREPTDDNDMLAAEVAALRPSAVHWARHSRQTQFLRRLAALIGGTGDVATAIALLQDASEITPADTQIAMLLSDALAYENDLAAALEALSPGLVHPSPSMRSVKKAIKLYQQMERFDEAIDRARKLAEQDHKHDGVVVSALVAASRRDEALLKARELLASACDELPVVQACYKALDKLEAGEAEIAAARARLLILAEQLGLGHLWRAQLMERDGDLEAAAAELEAGLASTPQNPQLLKKRADNALERGYWGREADKLLEAQPLAPAFSPLADGIAQADSLLRSFGGSLKIAAHEPERFAQIKIPECIFEHAVRSCPLPDPSERRSGVVMVAGSLGGYGAERILANTFRLLSTERRFGWTKFYVADFAKRTSSEFWQPLAGIPDSEIVLLDGTGRPQPPLSWIGGPMALAASRIFERLQRDRPLIVHASLDPLNVFAGLAALMAGVPRIVMHTHNMRPTLLHIRNSANLRGCYQALLARPEIVLAGCARACIDDYIDWLELKDATKTHVVYNGYEFNEITPADSEARTALRAEFGIAPNAIVIGTAMRLTDMKQPLVWVDAAAEIFSKRPDCHFIMFGDGDLRPAAEERVRELGLQPYFTFPGRVTDMYRRLPLLDLFMLSSRSEGLPNALIEAQAAGVPVIAFDVGGVVETMRPGETGQLVRELSAGALAATALEILASPQWHANASAAAPKFVRDVFSLEKMIVTLSGLFSEGVSDLN
ncbi:MAG TPA: glycosyltransferase [Rhizomicrobium sp.]|jgi:glycosyltransferase involved in cell wall biosynthesis/tetratricopeptide (TPR) repeat protein